MARLPDCRLFQDRPWPASLYGEIVIDFTLALERSEPGTLSNIYIPTTSAEQWAQFLAEPVKHWRQGYSARTLAYSWQEASGFPTEVGSVLASQFPAAELLLALPEHKVPLPGGSRPPKTISGCLLAQKASSFLLPLRARFQSRLAPPFRSGRQSPAPVNQSACRIFFLCLVCPLSLKLCAISFSIARRRPSSKPNASAPQTQSCWFTRSANPASGFKTTRRLSRSWAARPQKTAWVLLAVARVCSSI